MKLLDLYCCAGGASDGYFQAGFDEIVGVDINPLCKKWYPYKFINKSALDIDIDYIREFDLVHASPPCFGSGTPVVTKEGIVGIENVKIGDYVLTHKNRWRRVNNTFSQIKETVTDGLIVTTKDHRFLSMDANQEQQWIPASKLKGQYVAIPRMVETCGYELPNGIRESETFWYMVGRYLGDGWLRYVPSTGKRRKNAKLSKTKRNCINCNVKEARKRGKLWSSYCSKSCGNQYSRKTGPKSPRGTIIICSAHEESEELLKKLTEDGTKWVGRKERTVVKHYHHSTSLARWLRESFSYGSANKTIPGWILGIKREYREALFNGYIDADGCKTISGLRSSSVSKNLTTGMFLIGASLGFGVTSRMQMPNRECIIEGRKVNELPTYTATYSSNRYSVESDEILWRRKRKGFEQTKTKSVVYDLSVEEDESFVAWGYIVHNCQGHTSLRTRTGKQYEDLIPATREMLIESGVDYIIENVVSTNDHLIDPVMLCGSMFGLGADCSDGQYRQLQRHRLFETNFGFQHSMTCKHSGHPVGCYGNGAGGQQKRGYKAHIPEAKQALGFDRKVPRIYMNQSIPPAYAKFIGEYWLNEKDNREV